MLAPLAPGAAAGGFGPQDRHTAQSPWGQLLVPTVTLEDVINLVPWNVTIDLLKTVRGS